MSLTSLVLRFAAPTPKIEEFERFLFIGPHPDDIEIGAGATAAKLASAGKSVCFLICADGRYGDGFVSKEMSREELVRLRQEESIRSAAELYVNDVRFLELSDGGFYERDQLLRGIAECVSDFKPDVIFAPDPCVTSESHIDHINVGECARQVAYFAPYGGIMKEYGTEGTDVQALAFYMTAKPNRYVSVGKHFNTQLKAIFDCHQSQFPSGSPDAESIKLYLRLRSLDFGLRTFGLHAEGFRVLGKVHMHCLPEAGK